MGIPSLISLISLELWPKQCLYLGHTSIKTFRKILRGNRNIDRHPRTWNRRTYLVTNLAIFVCRACEEEKLTESHQDHNFAKVFSLLHHWDKVDPSRRSAYLLTAEYIRQDCPWELSEWWDCGINLACRRLTRFLFHFSTFRAWISFPKILSKVSRIISMLSMVMLKKWLNDSRHS